MDAWQLGVDMRSPNFTITNETERLLRAAAASSSRLMGGGPGSGGLPQWNGQPSGMAQQLAPSVAEVRKTRDSSSSSSSAATDPSTAAKVAAKQAELQQLLQQLYQAEATVQMEVGEVTRSQQIASEAEQQLEEATNKVRMLSSDLQAAQENAASCAMRAHTAQLQLAAHDQLMFTARQRVDALSAQMVSVQAELASVQNTFTLNESSQHLEQQGRLNGIYQFQQQPNLGIGIPAGPGLIAPPQPPGGAETAAAEILFGGPEQPPYPIMQPPKRKK